MSKLTLKNVFFGSSIIENKEIKNKINVILTRNKHSKKK